jgi:hypothetical protein
LVKPIDFGHPNYSATQAILHTRRTGQVLLTGENAFNSALDAGKIGFVAVVIVASQYCKNRKQNKLLLSAMVVSC